MDRTTGLDTIDRQDNRAGDTFARRRDFVSVGDNGNPGGGRIYEFTSGGQSVFAAGLYDPTGLAFSNTGNLVEADNGTNSMNELRGGVPTTFATGLNRPEGLGLCFWSLAWR